MHFEAIFRTSPNPYVLLTPDLTIVEANDAYLRATGRERGQLLGRKLFDAFPANPESNDQAQVAELKASFDRVLTERSPHTLALIKYEIPVPGGPGQATVFDERYWSATNSPIFDDSGELVGIVQHTVDVTDLHRRQLELDRDSRSLLLEKDVLSRAGQVQRDNLALGAQRDQLHRMFQQAPGFMAYLRGPDHVIDIANAAFSRLVGTRAVLGKPVREALPELTAQGYVELLDRVVITGEPFVGQGMRLLVQREPGAARDEVYVDVVYQPMLDMDGRVTGIFVQGHDVTNHKRVEEELRDYHNRLEDLVRERTAALEQSEAERRAAEAALHHVQKLEAVGKLTGGVAHDFNNVLQVIGGNLELLLGETAGMEGVQRRIGTALGTVEKGARLASQLLAFARRQPLEPATTDIGRLLHRTGELLRRVLGETIELRMVVEDGLWLSCVDRNRLENVILNLAINARDAMSHDGLLTLEAGNAVLDPHYASLHADVLPGDYVFLSVTDTGHGMSDAVQQRAFEPFFTTKPVGQGTGLGLSMVYGFVKQSGGHVKIDSEVGRGTTVKLYLPRSRSPEDTVDTPDSGPAVGGAETILVVEDDAEVRATVVETLGGLGYRVLQAGDGQAALALLKAGTVVDLLFTDVVMPGPIKSPELARQAKALLPALEVLFTSGYTENVIVHGGRLDPGVSLLSKPYRRDDLARKLRQVLRTGRSPSLQQPMNQTDSNPSSPPSSSSSSSSAKTASATSGHYDVLAVLYVEDHEDTRAAISECLDALGHEVQAVATAEEAITAAGARPFDVLFTDITLPGMSGIDLAAKLRAEQPRTRVIVASGYGRDPRVTALGADVVSLQKPYDIAAMETALEQCGRSLKTIDSGSST